MTIPDDPDEDAAELDDDALLQKYLGPPPSADHAGSDAGDGLPDWPHAAMRNVGLMIDTRTLAWFRSHHVDWQHQIGLVLRGWVTAQERYKEPGVMARHQSSR